MHLFVIFIGNSENFQRNSSFLIRTLCTRTQNFTLVVIKMPYSRKRKPLLISEITPWFSTFWFWKMLLNSKVKNYHSVAETRIRTWNLLTMSDALPLSYYGFIEWKICYFLKSKKHLNTYKVNSLRKYKNKDYIWILTPQNKHCIW